MLVAGFILISAKLQNTWLRFLFCKPLSCKVVRHACEYPGISYKRGCMEWPAGIN